MKHCGTRTIETERLTLRRLCISDANEMFFNWASDKEVTKYLTWPPHKSLDITQALLSEWVKEYENNNYYQWGIEQKKTRELIGTISIVDIKEDIGMVCVGYCLGREWWHQGIMTEALNAIINYMFEEVECNRIEARYDVRNPHSGEVMRKCGMSFEGILRNADKNNQGICDIGLFSILRSDYMKKHPNNKA